MSSVSSSASSSVCWPIKAASRSRRSLRWRGARPLQTPASKARRAACTARSTSAWPQAATSASLRPSMGLDAGNVAPSAALQ
ncbi:hypothetical protein G6F35_013770 [Rhizopus arrhizus]|nr:hypothetical protein G6F35_013770 [Rhizopus arrhizus]